MNERFTDRYLDNHERPRRFYEYFVTGRGDFPFDMLRYDACWPAGSEDAAKLYSSFEDRESRKMRSVKMWSHHEPTVDRWSSFNWSVGAERLVK